MVDSSRSIIEQVRRACAERVPLRIVGGDTKAFVGRKIEARPLAVAAHAGIVEHVAEELVLTARAGTTLAEIDDALDTHGQMLGFEPPRFGGAATIGGTLASNLSGPGRPWRGSIRDAVLGIRLVNGRGEHLRFGGKVMKNVAGFDVARLQAGAHGAFGVVTEVSLRVLPKPERDATLARACTVSAAVARMTELAAKPEPLSAAAWVAGTLYLRLSGAEAAVAQAMRRIGGDVLADASTFWHALNNLALPFFAGERPLWRFSVKPSLPVPDALGDWLLDWGGAQRYLRSDRATARATLEAIAAGGHVSRWRRRNDNDDAGDDCAQAPSAAVKALQIELKRAFDPERVLNPGRLYSWL